MIELHDLPAGLRVGGRGALPQPGLSAWPGNRYDLPVKTSNGGMGMETVGIVSTDDLGEAEPAREGGTAPVVLQPGEKRLVYLCALLTLLSFFVIPFLANLPLLFKLSKSRWQLFLMLLTLGAADAVVGMVVLVTRLV